MGDIEKCWLTMLNVSWLQIIQTVACSSGTQSCGAGARSGITNRLPVLALEALSVSRRDRAVGDSARVITPSADRLLRLPGAVVTLISDERDGFFKAKYDEIIERNSIFLYQQPTKARDTKTTFSWK